jgi:hypothetical protein
MLGPVHRMWDERGFAVLTIFNKWFHLAGRYASRFSFARRGSVGEIENSVFRVLCSRSC